MTKFKLQTPDGLRIVGTKETVPGVAHASTFDKNGEPEYEGGTEMDWDNQRSDEHPRGHSLVYVDEDGSEWHRADLTLIPEEEVSDDEV